MYRRMLLGVVASTLSMALLAQGGQAVAVGAGKQKTKVPTTEDVRLSAGLAAGVRSAGFDTLVDFDHRVDGVAQPASHLPNVDVAVLELSPSGAVRGAANVLYDRDSPKGYRVAVDRRSLSASHVEFHRWRQARWDEQSQWEQGPEAEDILVKPAVVDKRYMTTYPASVLKLMVGYSVLRLVDQGALRLTDRITYHDGPQGQSCAYGPSNPTGADPARLADGATDSLAGWFDQMITVSDNFATCVLLQEINDQQALAAANAHFRDIGLSTFRMLPSEPEVGSGWSSGTMTMGALDTAKLMVLVNGGPGTLWTTDRGAKITARALSQSSRKYFRGVLAEQSFNEVLNPVNLCGSTDAAPGIPSTVDTRWVDPDTGHVVTYDGDLSIDFGYDVRPCLADAEVRFAHKTGLTYNAGSDAGIVTAVPGEGGRRYVVAVFSNVGNRFGDADWATADPNACEDAPYVCYPRAFGRLGKAVDDLVKGGARQP